MASNPTNLQKGLMATFHARARDPFAWRRCAENLKKSSDCLAQALCAPRGGLRKVSAELSHGPAYMLLMGLAVENVLKAILIAGKPELVEDNRLSKKVAIHDLSKLWRLAGLRRCPSFDGLIRQLTESITAHGRYPVTRCRDQMANALGVHFSKTSIERCEKLWLHLATKCDAAGISWDEER